jgi:hypothetical protein
LAIDGLGVGTDDQTCPFQLSAKLSSWYVSASRTYTIPTASHDDIEAQETEFSDTSSPEGLDGVGTTAQLDPSHSSAREPNAGEGVEPTAIQKLLAMQETLESEASLLGVGTTIQLMPFHDSTRVPIAPPPTAMQKDSVTQETP